MIEERLRGEFSSSSHRHRCCDLPTATRRPLPGGATRKILGRCALAVIGASFGSISISALGTDLTTGSSRSITGPSQVMHADHRPVSVRPNAPSDTKLDYLALHFRTVDRLYEELMRSSGCLLASKKASIGVDVEKAVFRGPTGMDEMGYGCNSFAPH
jgi:hypothetical protein